MKTVLYAAGIYAACALLAWGAVTAQNPLPHDQQPEYCVNHEGNAKYPRTPETACACVRTCKPDEPEDPSCRTYCRRPQCKCRHGCET